VRLHTLLAITTLLTVLAGAGAAAPRDPVAGQSLKPLPADGGRAGVYIVQLKAPAVLAREPGRRQIRARTGSARREAERLSVDHDDLLRAIGASPADKVYSYRYALNGFAARLTPAQARKLESRRDVRRVWPDRAKSIATNASPRFLGLLSTTGGLRADLKLSGENVVIGVIDSGIAPGHPSFRDKVPADRPRLCRSTWASQSLLGLWLCRRYDRRDDRLVYQPPENWNGTCQTGDRWLARYCNNKLIGARWYVQGFLQQYAVDPNEILSARDVDGHGTHIASTAAGNRVDAVLGGTRVAKVVGIAPRARIAVYKACWLEPGQLRGTCATSDLTQAIEDAVADGVDIINYSIGSYDDINDPDDLALLAAAEAGVLTVAAAGNEGPEPGSMLSPAAAPWVLAVGASSRRGERFQELVRVNAPSAVQGDYAAREAGFTPALSTAGPLTLELALADDGVAGVFDGVTGTTFDGCETITNVSSLTGRIALVQRGGCSFQEKLENVEAAGAAAAIVFNDRAELTVMSGMRGSVDIPAVLIGQADGDLLLQRLQDEEVVQVTLDKSLYATIEDPGNQMRAFSARGPSIWEPNILKPDLTAPGVDILAGQTPDVANNVRGERFQYLSGTSMSAPHVTGVAALLKQAHPDWSPAALKSALVTTARQNIVKEDGSTPANPFDFGGGHLLPNPAVAPGLVFDAGAEDYAAFQCGRGEAPLGADCAGLVSDGFSTDPSDLNQPSIAIDSLVSERTVRRRVTNVGPPDTFVASVDTPNGIELAVEPATLTLGTGSTADLEVQISVNGAVFDAWQFGAVRFTGSTTTARMPLALRALGLDAPVLATGSGTTGSLTFETRIGYAGSFNAVLNGFEASGATQPAEIQALLEANTVQDDPDDLYEFVQPGGGALPPDVRRIPILVPAGTRYLRVALDSSTTSAGADLDLYLYSCPDFDTCIESAEPSVESDSTEVINLVPAPGETFLTAGAYYVDVHGYDVPGTAVFDLGVWTVGAVRGNGTVSAPGSVTAGNPASITVNWQDLPSGLNLGLIVQGDEDANVDQTVIEVSVP
jgi:subtilisin family serine protease